MSISRAKGLILSKEPATGPHLQPFAPLLHPVCSHANLSAPSNPLPSSRFLSLKYCASLSLFSNKMHACISPVRISNRLTDINTNGIILYIRRKESHCTIRTFRFSLAVNLSAVLARNLKIKIHITIINLLFCMGVKLGRPH